MTRKIMFVTVLLGGLALATGAWGAHHEGGEEAENPCAENPCAENPCAENPCAENPCAENPCADNPCGGGGEE